MFNARLKDGSQLFDHLRGSHATVVVTPGGAKILVRPDGYVATIGAAQVSEYAGQQTKVISADLEDGLLGGSG